jgi:hypothetical protein
MYSASFPTEIWLSIAVYLECREYLSLVLVSRGFYQLFLASLYSSLVITIPTAEFGHGGDWDVPGDMHPARFAPAGPKVAPLLERLDTHPTLRNYVRSIHIVDLSMSTLRLGLELGLNPIHSNSGFVWAVINLLGTLPLLQRVEFTNVDMFTECVLSLSSHLTQQLEICITNGNIYDAPLSTSSRKITARALSLCGLIHWPHHIEALRLLLQASSMRKLDIGMLPQDVLNLTYMDGGKPQLSHLESLTIPYIDVGELEIFSAMKNLRKLIFSSQSQVWHVGVGELPLGNGASGVLKNLEVISMHNTMLFPFTAGRRIEEISTFDTLTVNIDLDDLGGRFGSEVMVKSVEWRRCGRVDMVVDYITAKNTGVWYLTIESSQAMGESEVGERTFLIFGDANDR